MLDYRKLDRPGRPFYSWMVGALVGWDTDYLRNPTRPS